MQRSYLFLLVILILATARPCYAEAVPDYALDKDYENCMGGETAAANPERNKFCGCARDEMRQWSLDQYGAAASEQAKNSNDTSKVIDVVGEIAKVCMKRAFQ